MKHHDPNSSVARDGAERDKHDDSKILVTIPTVALDWSPWTPWTQLPLGASNQVGVNLPDSPGVYQVKHTGQEELLAIGTTPNIRIYVQQGLTQWPQLRSRGRHLPEHEDLGLVEIRWASVTRYDLAEVELLARHLARFGRLPKYTGFI